jgi:hypothetical protein
MNKEMIKPRVLIGNDNHKKFWISLKSSLSGLYISKSRVGDIISGEGKVFGNR